MCFDLSLIPSFMASLHNRLQGRKDMASVTNLTIEAFLGIYYLQRYLKQGFITSNTIIQYKLKNLITNLELNIYLDSQLKEQMKNDNLFIECSSSMHRARLWIVSSGPTMHQSF